MRPKGDGRVLIRGLTRIYTFNYGPRFIGMPLAENARLIKKEAKEMCRLRDVKPHMRLKVLSSSCERQCNSDETVILGH